MGMWDTFKELANPIGPQSGPLGRMLGMDEKDKRKMDPQQQYWGGSKEAYDASIARYKAGASGGAAMADGAVDDARTAAAGARNAYSALGGDWKEYNAEQSNEAAQADSGFDRSMADYRSGRAGVLNNAGRIEASAVGLPQSYQQTADRAFQLNQTRAERAAMAQGARGGAGGLRTAIASQAAAGADASAQAEIIRAQEFNDLQRQQRDAYATAAGIRAGQGAQDQGAGQIYAGRQQNSAQPTPRRAMPPALVRKSELDAKPTTSAQRRQPTPRNSAHLASTRARASRTRSATTRTSGFRSSSSTPRPESIEHGNRHHVIRRLAEPKPRRRERNGKRLQGHGASGRPIRQV
jgi:hypothetical protein